MHTFRCKNGLHRNGDMAIHWQDRELPSYGDLFEGGKRTEDRNLDMVAGSGLYTELHAMQRLQGREMIENSDGIGEQLNHCVLDSLYPEFRRL